jgi:hypothetical protein
MQLQTHEYEIMPRVSEALSALDLLSQQSMLFLSILITLELNSLLLHFWSFVLMLPLFLRIGSVLFQNARI